jgi:hypothetical protein
MLKSSWTKQLRCPHQQTCRGERLDSRTGRSEVVSRVHFVHLRTEVWNTCKSAEAAGDEEGLGNQAKREEQHDDIS